MYNSILLSQLDAWLMQAKLMPAPVTRTQTGLIYMRYKYNFSSICSEEPVLNDTSVFPHMIQKVATRV